MFRSIKKEYDSLSDIHGKSLALTSDAMVTRMSTGSMQQ
jgi:hypothetical protein